MKDIRKILTENKVFWVDKGNNVAKGNINIQCPFCGSDDHSQHMGISITTNKWGCWRNEKHRGSNIARLLSKLNIYISDDRGSTMQKLINRTFFAENKTETEITQEVFTKELPDEFVMIDDSTIFNRPFLNYLKKRGFDDPVEVAKMYDLRRTMMANKWAARLIIPVRVNDWVTWTGRAIGYNPLRYLSPSKEEATNIKQTVFNFNDLKDTTGDILVITEGPFDAIKIDYNCRPSIRATCLFGLSYVDHQLNLLRQLCYNFSTILIGLDPGTIAQSVNLRKHLLEYSPLLIKPSEKDFGDMSKNEIQEVITKYAN